MGSESYARANASRFVKGHEFVRLEKLSGLDRLQYDVVRKYVCVWCENFGFSIMIHLWMCELGLWQKGKDCPSYVVNKFLCESSYVELEFDFSQRKRCL